MNPWIIYGLGVITLPVGLWLYGTLVDLKRYIGSQWVGIVYWRDERVWKRWEWSIGGRVLSYTPKHWPSRGLGVKVRPWRAQGPIDKPPSMADHIHPIRVERDEVTLPPPPSSAQPAPDTPPQPAQPLMNLLDPTDLYPTEHD